MGRSYEYDEVVDGVTLHHLVTQTDATDALVDATKSADSQLWAQATATSLSRELTKAPPPVYVPPAPYAAMPDGSILTVGPDGQVYKDGARLGAALVSVLARIGTSVYGFGRTDGKCYRWTGTSWIEVPKYDPNLLNPAGVSPPWT